MTGILSEKKKQQQQPNLSDWIFLMMVAERNVLPLLLICATNKKSARARERDLGGREGQTEAKRQRKRDRERERDRQREREREREREI